MILNDIETALKNIEPYLESTCWIIGGSAALVLQGHFETANDIDIMQHSGPRVALDNDFEARMWSRYYPDLQIDLHYSNPFCTDDYNPVFKKIIAAIDYVDFKHNEPYKNWIIATPLGAGLINWLHHFLEYGFNPERTICPTGDDAEHLQKILTPSTFETIQWKVDQNRVGHPEAHLAFEKYAKTLPEKRRKEA